MSYGRTLQRRLDADLVNKILEGWKPDGGRTLSTRSKIRGSTTYQPAREAKTYRAARRNATIHRKVIERKESQKAAKKEFFRRVENVEKLIRERDSLYHRFLSVLGLRQRPV